MSKVEIVDGCRRDVSYVAANMRACDRREIFAVRDVESTDQLALQIHHHAPLQQVARIGREPVAVLSAVQPRAGIWQVGLFATPRWPLVARAMTRHARAAVIPDLLARGANRAECQSIEGHHAAHRWLEWLGAVHECDLIDYGKNRETFRLYAWRRSDFDHVPANPV